VAKDFGGFAIGFEKGGGKVKEEEVKKSLSYLIPL
jgi:hypothetical protein